MYDLDDSEQTDFARQQARHAERRQQGLAKYEAQADRRAAILGRKSSSPPERRIVTRDEILAASGIDPDSA